MDGAELQSQILAWLAEDKTRGYKAASRKFGVPYDTIKGWAKTVAAGRPAPTPNARTGARANRGPPPEPPVPVAFDPSTGSYEEFLIARLAASMVARDQALTDHHAGVARQWETTIGGYREELERVRDESRRKDEAKGRSERVDIEDVAKRLCRRAGILARLAPAEARRLYHELGVALGEREAG